MNAKTARKLVEKAMEFIDLTSINELIESAARSGNSKLKLTKYVSDLNKSELKRFGFNLPPVPAQEIDKIKCIIHW